MCFLFVCCFYNNRSKIYYDTRLRDFETRGNF